MSKLEATLAALILTGAVSCVEIDPGHRAETVIGGSATSAGEFPAAGALILYGDGQSTPLQYVSCSGTLIAPDVVLTAGHCTHQMMTQGETPDFTFALDGMNAPSNQIYAGASAVAHPSFNPYGSAPTGLEHVYDIGLLFLEEPVTGVAPAILPRPGESSAIVADGEVDIVGYGFTVENDLDHYGVKNDATTHIAAVGDWELQIANPGEPQNCQGDSGGPAFRDLGAGQRLISVVSRGTTQDTTDCSQGGIHTRVDAYLDWIESQAELPCGSGLEDDCEDTPDAGTPPATPDAGTPSAQPDAASGPAPGPDAGSGGDDPGSGDDPAGDDCSCPDCSTCGGCSSTSPSGSAIWVLFFVLPLCTRRRFRHQRA